MLNAKFFEIFDGNAFTKVSPKNLKASLKQLHQLMQNCAKWKNVLNLHILSKKTPTSVGIKLCIYTQLLQYPCIYARLLQHLYLLFYQFFLSHSLCLSSCSHSHLTLTAADHQRAPHHASTENTTSKSFFQNQVKQEISLHRICLVAEKNTKKTRNKEN